MKGKVLTQTPSLGQWATTSQQNRCSFCGISPQKNYATRIRHYGKKTKP